ncbi:hypothetical protein OSTOST_20237, partial [Ostertagia ostertagi]
MIRRFRRFRASTLFWELLVSAAKLTTLVPLPDGSSSSGLVFLSIILFVVAVAVIAKIIYSNKKRRSDLIGGTARWRLAASQQSGAAPQQTAANYAPMGGVRPANATNGLDTPGPDRLDWERQFFDDTEATVCPISPAAGSQPYLSFHRRMLSMA